MEAAGRDLTGSGRMWLRLAPVGLLAVALLAQPASYHRCLHMAEPLASPGPLTQISQTHSSKAIPSPLAGGNLGGSELCLEGCRAGKHS